MAERLSREALYEQVMNAPKLSEETKASFAAGWLCGKMDATERERGLHSVESK
jgi:hypothetical protein